MRLGEHVVAPCRWPEPLDDAGQFVFGVGEDDGVDRCEFAILGELRALVYLRGRAGKDFKNHLGIVEYALFFAFASCRIAAKDADVGVAQIGRASCRERVCMSV